MTDQLPHRTLQILRKDTERLWWAILPTLALLAYWTFGEITRPAFDFSDPVPRGVWLNMVLPFAWTLLIALAIHQDSLVGDRQFWVALPCGWRPLLAAKAAFIAAFIQIPYLLATAAILLLRGFNPVLHIPHLFWKQLVLLGLILPALAVAAVVKNMAQFMLVLITVASGVVLFSTRLNMQYHYGPETSWDVRWILTMLILGGGGLAVGILQFARRCTIRSRAIGVVTALAAASLYSWLPRDTSAAIYVAFSPEQPGRAPVSLGLSTEEPDNSNQLRRYAFQRTTVLIPIAFSGLPAAAPDLYPAFDQISLELIGSNGERYEWETSSDGAGANRIDADADDHWQSLVFYSPAFWNRLVTGPVTLHGRVLARLYRIGEHTALRSGDRKDVAGIGHCVNNSGMDSRADLRKMSVLECESAEVSLARAWPGDVLPAFRGFPLHEPGFYGPTYYPQDPWLSPLRHGMSSIAGTGLNVWTVAPQTQFDTVIVDYTLPALDLNRYVVHKPVKPEAAK